MRLNYYYPNIKYIAVPEFQQRGAVHYHILLNLPYVPIKRIEKIWSHGWAWINRIDMITNVGFYISKYITKSVKDPRYFRKKRYFTSKNLSEPIIYYDNEADTFVNVVNGYKKRIQKNWIVPFLGSVEYNSYRFDKNE